MQYTEDEGTQDAPARHSLQPAFARGERVLARGYRWRVVDVSPFPACTLLHLAGIEPEIRSAHTRLLTPFDRPRRLDAVTRLRIVSKRHALLALAALASRGELRTAAAAEIDILPHQLDPALMLLGGEATRLLLADEVGLGKTIQAGLAISELLASGRAARVLVLTPAGLREQWIGELAQHFYITAALVDASSLRRRMRELPRSINPWTTWPVVVASIDFAKRPGVLMPLADARWDLIVIDEAHGVGGAPDRHEAVARLTASAHYVLLLTATPHNGDEGRYHLLTNLGRHHSDDSIVVVRRTRHDVGLSVDRRVHLLPVRLTEIERRMHRELATYARRVDAAARRRHDATAVLAMIVLMKRALSCPRSLLRSIDRRIELLSTGESSAAVQIALPLSLDEDCETDPFDEAPDQVLGCAGLDDPLEEHRWLVRLRARAAEASGVDSKLRVVTKLLRRICEPVVLFTEYRDTLLWLRDALTAHAPLVLHGGIDARQRAAIAESFRRGEARLLLATDVAAEGLNLQARCRTVVNLELPWTPARLEQRIGRVDRLGQTRRVHAFNFLARGTAETEVLGRLVRRLTAMRNAVGEISTPVGAFSDEVIFEAALSTGSVARRMFRTRAIAPAQISRPAIGANDLAEIAAPALPRITTTTARSLAEADRLIRCRRSWQQLSPSASAANLLTEIESSLPWVALVRPPTAFPRGLLAVFRVRVSYGVSRAIDDLLIPLVAPDVRLSAGQSVRELVRQSLPQLRARAEREARRLCKRAVVRSIGWRKLWIARDQRIRAAEKHPRQLSQQHLFRRIPLQTDDVGNATTAGVDQGVIAPTFDPPELVLVIARVR